MGILVVKKARVVPKPDSNHGNEYKTILWEVSKGFHIRWLLASL